MRWVIIVIVGAAILAGGTLALHRHFLPGGSRSGGETVVRPETVKPGPTQPTGSSAAGSPAPGSPVGGSPAAESPDAHGAVLSGYGAWPIFRGDQALGGVAAVRLPEHPVLLWKYQTGGPVKSPAVVVHGRVFVGSDDGCVYALSLASGDKLWSFETQNSIQAAPLYVDGVVYVGSHDGNLYALDSGTGKLKWKYQTGDMIMGSANWTVAAGSAGAGSANTPPGLADSPRGVASVNTPGVESAKPRDSLSRGGPATWILVGSCDNKLHCVDAATGQAVWTFATGGYINGSPAVAGGVAVFGGCDERLHAVGVARGDKVAEVPVGGAVAGSVALRDGRAYLGHLNNEFRCVEVAGGATIWTFHDLDYPYYSSPAVAGDVVLFGGRDMKVHCVERATGRTKWTMTTHGEVDSSPVIAGDKVVFGSGDGRLYIVSLADGRELWSYEIGDAVVADVAVAGPETPPPPPPEASGETQAPQGVMVIGACDGRVYAFGSQEP
jgi:outer membrane protein assembly factor BamB